MKTVQTMNSSQTMCSALACERNEMSKCFMCTVTIIPKLTEKRAIVLNTARQVKRDIYSFILEVWRMCYKTPGYVIAQTLLHIYSHTDVIVISRLS